MKTRKELKEEYKQKKYQIGVYCIRNNANAKVFIGGSIDLNAAWNAQRYQLSIGMHRNPDLQNDWNKYGAENFTYEILEEIKQTDDNIVDYNKEVKILEEVWFEQLQPYVDKGYNKKPKPTL